MPDRDGMNGSARVFFALWPGPGTLSTLVHESKRLHALYGGRPTCPATMHLTLVFIGAVPRSRLIELLDLARGFSAEPFDIDFDQAGCWRHNKVAWVAPTRVPEKLGALVSRLELALTEHGIDFDRRDYRPHVTLARKADCHAVPPAEVTCAISWPAREFLLVESRLCETRADYAVLGRFPLAG